MIKYFLLILISAIFITSILVLPKVLSNHQEKIPLPLVVFITPSPIPPTLTPIPTQSLSPNLEDTIQHQLIGTYGTYGIAVKNLKTGESYFSNEHRPYESASLYKLWVMATAYQQIKNGTLHENDILSQDVAVLNSEFNIAPEDAEQTDGTITLSVNDALNQMITISDNYAALLLSEKVNLANVVSFLAANGFNESKIGINGGAPTVTPYDAALFFEKIYKHQLVDTQSSDKMLNLLKAQRLNNKIPKYLPSDIVTAHKTGELDQFSHDAGIVYGTNGDYIMALLSESDDPPLAEERIANVARTIFNYFEEK